MSFSIPLYDVLTPYGIEGDAYGITMSNAKLYQRALDTTGIPATVKYSKSITVAEYLGRKW